MRISVKGRYALAAVITIAQRYSSGEYVTVISIAEKLGISKIYLEQVFSLLKRGGIVTSVKGMQGGYQLTQTPRQITALDVLSAVELSLFEKTEETVAKKAPEVEYALRETVFDPLDSAIKDSLGKITVYDLVNAVEKRLADTSMYYI